MSHATHQTVDLHSMKPLVSSETTDWKQRYDEIALERDRLLAERRELSTLRQKFEVVILLDINPFPGQGFDA